ncbi:RDD family protein [Streptomyces sp. NPDC006530]|uniref:RDD family protein n=1 Tax=Streptomyces sp. NPDC006530 TaxID=3364750 RepID=UPI003684369C
MGRPASRGRRYAAAVMDGTLALGCGLATGTGYLLLHSVADSEHGRSHPGLGASLLAGVAGFSFVNHVLLVLLCRASVGKAVAGVRVVRAADGGRPRVHQALGRWLGGLTWGVIVLPFAYALGGSEAEPQDFAGLRIIHPG